MPTPFHLAFNVRDLDEARAFYENIIGCGVGRSTQSWIDFDFFGHQLSVHLGKPFVTRKTGRVGEHSVPMPHFGVVLEMTEWQHLAHRLSERNLEFIIKPTVRFCGEPGEQATMFFTDPSGNPIEIQGFSNLDAVFTN